MDKIGEPFAEAGDYIAVANLEQFYVVEWLSAATRESHFSETQNPVAVIAEEQFYVVAQQIL